MSDITPFLHPTEPKTADNSNEINKLTAELAEKFAPADFNSPNNITLSDEDLEGLRDLAVGDATQIIKHLDPILREKQEDLNRQVKAIESIAEQACNLARSTAQQADILKEQLDFTKSEAASANKDALFAKITSIIAILVSITAIIVPVLLG